MLRERDADAHSPILITVEPSGMTNQEKKNFQTDEARRQRAATRKEIHKANEAKGKGPCYHLKYTFSSEKLAS